MTTEEAVRMLRKTSFSPDDWFAQLADLLEAKDAAERGWAEWWELWKLHGAADICTMQAAGRVEEARRRCDELEGK
jgi:hypothetical protein